jgi:glycosyltransferase involved in cell wall biosynthesis
VNKKDLPAVAEVLLVSVIVSAPNAQTKIERTLWSVRLKCTGRQSGAAEARNVGIESSCRAYIAFLDADDEWLAGKLTRQMDLLSRHPAMTFVTCEANLIGLGDRYISRINPGRARAIGVNAWKTLLAYACVATPCAARSAMSPRPWSMFTIARRACPS